MGALALETKKEMKVKANVFCSFLLSKLEVVLPVEMIQEVVNFPENVVKVPLSPDYIVGVFNLRGHIIPIANMHCLLKTSGEITSACKIVIVHLNEIKMGLLFDSTSEILKVTDEEICKFDYADKREGFVCGALKLNNGEKIIQIIDPQSLIRLEAIPHIVDKIKLSGKNIESKTETKKKRKQCISFVSHNVCMALEMDEIHEILKFQKLEPGFVNYDYSLGLLSLRGAMVPVIHFSQFLGGEGSRDQLDDKKIVIIKTRKDHKLGLLVDSVEDIISYFEQDLMTIPQMGSEKKDFYSSVVMRGEKEIILLNHKLFIENPDIANIVDGHANLFKVDETQKVLKKKIERHVYISFKIEADFSLPIQDIREIVTYPSHIIAPPGTKSYITGLFNLRDKVVTIVDMRKYYGIDEISDINDSKVLIVENGKDSYGLVVDVVDQIFSVNSDEKFPIPQHLTTKTEKKLGDDMKEIVMICSKKEEKDTKLIVLDVKKILSRVSLE